MTTAEVFSNYLGLTPENAPWAFGDAACELCGGAGGWWTVAGDGAEQETQCPTCYHGRVQGLTATSPLAHEPTPGWLEMLVRHERFSGLRKNADTNVYTAEFKTTDAHACDLVFVNRPNEVLATALAFMSSDPTLREACERAVDYEKETSNEN